MSELKCPFCNKPLQPTLRQSDEYWCENYDCPGTNIEWVGSQKLWQELAEMKRKFEMANGELNYIQKQVDKDQNLAKVEDLRKKLKIACETLKRIGANYPRMGELYRMKLANDAIEQITKKRSKHDKE